MIFAIVVKIFVKRGVNVKRHPSAVFICASRVVRRG